MRASIVSTSLPVRGDATPRAGVTGTERSETGDIFLPPFNRLVNTDGSQYLARIVMTDVENNPAIFMPVRCLPF
jgi:hypothetical protein